MKRILSASRGFTIVELLIVIVVIAILAAITVVAFNGVQSRAHDSSVQADLNGMQKKIQAAVVTGDLPTTAEAFSNLAKPSSGYMTTSQPEYSLLALPTGETTPDGYSFFAQSRSGKVFTAIGGSVARNATSRTIDQTIQDLEGWVSDAQEQLADAQASNDQERIAEAEEYTEYLQWQLEVARGLKASGADPWSLAGQESSGQVEGMAMPLQAEESELLRRYGPVVNGCRTVYQDGYVYDAPQGRWLAVTFELYTSCLVG